MQSQVIKINDAGLFEVQFNGQPLNCFHDVRFHMIRIVVSVTKVNSLVNDISDVRLIAQVRQFVQLTKLGQRNQADGACVIREQDFAERIVVKSVLKGRRLLFKIH
jgi:hypothetical protein